jgi:hypothetical protein
MWEDLTLGLDILGFAFVVTVLVIELPAMLKPVTPAKRRDHELASKSQHGPWDLVARWAHPLSHH